MSIEIDYLKIPETKRDNAGVLPIHDDCYTRNIYESGSRDVLKIALLTQQYIKNTRCQDIKKTAILDL